MIILEFNRHTNFEKAAKLLVDADISFATEIEPARAGSSWIYFYENNIFNSATEQALKSAQALELGPAPILLHLMTLEAVV